MAYRTDFGSIHQRPLGVFGAPARYVQGPGATWELGRELQRLGFQGPVLFIAGGTAQRTSPRSGRSNCHQWACSP